MSGSDFKSVFERIRSAGLLRILIVYILISWGVLEALDVLSSQFGLPEWYFPAGIGLLLIGLPILAATALMQSSPSRVEGLREIELSAEPSWTAPHRWFTWKRAILGGVLAFATLGSIGLAMIVSRDRGSELQPDVVAVMPFHAVGEEVDIWREGLVDLLATALDGTGAFHASDPRAVLIRWGRTVGDVDELADPEQAADVAGALGAGQMILGSVISTGPGEVRLAAELFSVRWLRKSATAVVEGPESEMTSLIDQLTVDLLKSVWGGEDVPEVRVSSITTSSIPALRAYLEGEQAFRRSDFVAARDAFTRALEVDSTFAVAAHRLSLSYGWSGLGQFEQEHRDNAITAARHTAGLPARDSLLILGHKLVDIDGDLSAIRLYERLTARYPDDFEAWYGLGEAYFHLGPAAGQSEARTIEALERAYALDSTLAPALIHLVQSSYSIDDLDRQRKWTRKYLALDSTSSFAQGLRLGSALRLGQREDSLSVTQQLDTLDSGSLGAIMFAAPPGRSDLAYSEMVYLARANPRHPAGVRVGALFGLSREYLRHGQIGSWMEIDREARRLQGREGGLFLLTMARLMELAPDSLAGDLHERLAAREAYPEDASHLALLYAEEGRFEEARLAVDWLSLRADSLAAVGNTAQAQRTRGLALTFQGHLAAAQDSAEAAIDYFERGLSLIGANYGRFTRDLHRYYFANLIQDHGEELQALRIYGSLYQTAWLEALGYLRRAQLHERRREQDDALQYYSWFLELWDDADPHLQPQVESARRARERLTAEQAAS